MRPAARRDPLETRRRSTRTATRPPLGRLHTGAFLAFLYLALAGTRLSQPGVVAGTYPFWRLLDPDPASRAEYGTARVSVGQRDRGERQALDELEASLEGAN
jgi:hypothetical protein